MQFLSYDMRSSMLSLKVLRIVCEASRDNHVSITVAYKRLKTMEN